MGINENGQIVGYSAVDDQGIPHNHAFVYEDGTMKDLGTLGGSTSYANAINDLGHIVGYTTTSDESEHAFLYTQAMGMVDLNDLIDPTLGWTLMGAEAMNNNGWIVGTGYNSDGEMRGFLLISNAVIPEPSSLVMTALSLTACAGAALARRRSTVDA